MSTLITLLGSSVGPVAKKYDNNGKKLKGFHFSKGNFWTYQIKNMTDLKNLIILVKPYHCLMLGVFDIFQGQIVTSNNFEAEKSNTLVRTRSKTHTHWHKESVLFFDYDYLAKLGPKMAAMNFQELYMLIIEVLPEFENVEMLFKYSSSSNIYDISTNTYVSSKVGMHVFFRVVNTSTENVKNFVELLKRRLWKLGYAQLEKDVAGSTQEVYLFDMSIFSQEREVIVSAPILPPNLAVYAIGNEPTIFNTDLGAFDLSTVDFTLEPEYQKFDIRGDNKSRTQHEFMQGGYTNTNDRLNYIKVSLLKNSKTKYRTINKFFNGEIVCALLRHLGYHVVSSKFKFRSTERTASCSVIQDSGYIFDFGGSFKGTILDLLIVEKGLIFKTALQYLYICLGANDITCDAILFGDLPDPKKIAEKMFDGLTLNMKMKIPKTSFESKKQNVSNKVVDDSTALQKLFRENLDLEALAIDELEIVLGKPFVSQKITELKKMNNVLNQNGPCLGYSYKYKSLTISFVDNGTVNTVSMRRNNATKTNEDWTKWKKHGSINHILAKFLNDTRIYIAFGMLEAIVLEALNVSYILFQSDSVAKNLEKNNQFLELRNSVYKKDLVVFMDNDDSCRETVKIFKKLFQNANSIEIVDFEELLGHKLMQGYDLVDYIKENLHQNDEPPFAKLNTILKETL